MTNGEYADGLLAGSNDTLFLRNDLLLLPLAFVFMSSKTAKICFTQKPGGTDTL